MNRNRWIPKKQTIRHDAWSSVTRVNSLFAGPAPSSCLTSTKQTLVRFLLWHRHLDGILWKVHDVGRIGGSLTLGLSLPCNFAVVCVCEGPSNDSAAAPPPDLLTSRRRAGRKRKADETDAALATPRSSLHASPTAGSQSIPPERFQAKRARLDKITHTLFNKVTTMSTATTASTVSTTASSNRRFVRRAYSRPRWGSNWLYMLFPWGRFEAKTIWRCWRPVRNLLNCQFWDSVENSSSAESQSWRVWLHCFVGF